MNKGKLKCIRGHLDAWILDKWNISTFVAEQLSKTIEALLENEKPKPEERKDMSPL